MIRAFTIIASLCVAISFCGLAAFAQGGPQDVEHFIERMDRCENYWTADGSESEAIKAETASAATEFQCEALPCDHAGLIKKYKGQKSAKDISDVMTLILPADSKFYAACNDK